MWEICLKYRKYSAFNFNAPISVKTEHASSCISLLSLNFSPSLHSSGESPSLKNFVPAEFVNEKFSEVALLIFSMCSYLPKGTRQQGPPSCIIRTYIKNQVTQFASLSILPTPQCKYDMYGTFHFGIP